MNLNNKSVLTILSIVVLVLLPKSALAQYTKEFDLIKNKYPDKISLDRFHFRTL